MGDRAAELSLCHPVAWRRRAHKHSDAPGGRNVVGYGLVRGPVAPRLEGLVPAFGAASLLFGVWYALSMLAPIG